MAQMLLTVSGTIAPNTDEQVACGARPRADYLELAHACDADLIDYAAAHRSGGWIARLLERTGSRDLGLAWTCFRRRGDYTVIFTDGEQVGIPLALLCKYFGWASRRPYHLMITHVISTPKKMLFFDWLGVQSHIDRLLVYSTWQKRFIETRWHLPPGRVIFTPFMVDAQFFRPEHITPNHLPRPLICAIGREARDYPTLLQAVDGIDADVVVNAESNWSRRSKNMSDLPIPDNVTIPTARRTFRELRQLYADSRFVVIPLYNITFQAGVTTILEAMAMERAVICTRTPGQIDVIIDGETGLYVPPGDPQALRTAITYLLDHPEEAERMGRAGRQRVEQGMTIEHYVGQLSSYVKMYASSAPGMSLMRR